MSKNIFELVLSDLSAAKTRDPAARNYLEIFFTYSGFHAILFYRICHFLWKLKLKFLSRFLSNLARILTAVEIHPAARIGSDFFIDHGTGLVIGETSKIGNNVTLYQHTTLGGISPAVNTEYQRDTKRHPTLEDNVIVGSGAQILGPVTIGKNSRIGANAVVLNDVPEDMTFVGIPARKLELQKFNKDFDPYGISVGGKIDDPNKKSIHALFIELHKLNEKFLKLQNEFKGNEKINITKSSLKNQKAKIKAGILK